MKRDRITSDVALHYCLTHKIILFYYVFSLDYRKNNETDKMNANKINKIRNGIVRLRETKKQLDELEEIKNNYQTECRSYLHNLNQKQYDLILKLDHAYAHASWDLSESDKSELQDVIKYLVTKLVDSYLQEKNCYLLDIEGDEEIEKFIAMYNKHSDVDFETVNKQLDAALFKAVKEGIKHYDYDYDYKREINYDSVISMYRSLPTNRKKFIYCPFYTSSKEMEGIPIRIMYYLSTKSSCTYLESLRSFNDTYEKFYAELMITKLASADKSVKDRLLPQLQNAHENQSLIYFLFSLPEEDASILSINKKKDRKLRKAFLYELAITSISIEDIALDGVQDYLESLTADFLQMWKHLKNCLDGFVCTSNQEVQKVLDSKLKQVKNAIEQTEQAIKKTQNQETLCQWLKSVS